ncbi:DNA topoisomerase 3-beta [Bienertia sinuspersici]
MGRSNNGSLDFPETFQNWTATDPLDLFQAPVLKSESNPKVRIALASFAISHFLHSVSGAHIRRHLNQEARGCSHLVLWLDCDREGENICFEGMHLQSSFS